MAFINRNARNSKARNSKFPSHHKSAVNSMQFANQMPKRIQNRVYRQCALDGFNERIRKELAGEDTSQIRLYSHHSTRQMYFKYGYNSVTERHINFARLKAQHKPKEH